MSIDTLTGFNCGIRPTADTKKALSVPSAFLHVSVYPAYMRQFFANSAASLLDQSPLGFSFIWVHQSGEPTSGEHAATPTVNAATKPNVTTFFKTAIPKSPPSEVIDVGAV